MIPHYSLSMLDNFITMVKLAMSFHAPEMKQLSKQWLEKGKAKVYTIKKKQIVLAFLDSKDLI